jgi:hypothetical protein
MANIYQPPLPIPATSGTLPNLKFMIVGDNLAAVTTAGYLTSQALEGYTLSNNDILMMLYSYNQQTGAGSFGIFTVSIAGATGVITLTSWSNPGEVILPTIANHIATYTNTTGTLSEDPATAISGGNIQAGLSGTAGYLASFPATSAKGSLRVVAVANTGDTLVTISNALHGQASVYSIPDAANAVGRFLVGATATPFVSGNFPVASGTAGLMVDSGKSAAALPTFTSPTIANHIAVFTNTSGNLGEDAATAINGGNLQAGLSGTAGTVASFPGTASNGSLILAAVDAGGAFNTTISNGTMAQSCVYTIPDVTAATGQFLVKTAALVSGNLVQASGTAGVTVDSGVATTNVQLKTQVKAATTGNIGGAGAGPITVTVAGLTAASVVVATIATSSNVVAVAKAVAGSGNFDVTFTGDPGATCTLNYVAYIASQ